MKKSQIWYMDFIIGVTIFLIIMVIAFRFLTNNYIIPGKEIDILQVELDKLSENLMRTGIPANWTEEDVVSIGLLSEDKSLDITKVNSLANLSSSYESLKWLLGINNDFIIFFEDSFGNQIDLTEGKELGKQGTNVTDILSDDPQNIMSSERYVLYRHDGIAEILAMKIVMWKE